MAALTAAWKAERAALRVLFRSARSSAVDTRYDTALPRDAACTWVLTERSNHAAMALYRAAGGCDDIPDVAMFTFTTG